jgi:hypothetical protein
MATFNYKENANYDFAGNDHQDDTYQLDTYMPGIYRVHNTEGSPYYIDMGEYVSAYQMETYIENHFEFSQDGDSVTGLDYMGVTFEKYTRKQMVEMLCATPFNRKLFKGHVSFAEWQEFHKTRQLNEVADYIQRDDSSESWSIGDSTLFYIGNNQYQHSTFESGTCHKMLQHCSQEDIHNYWLENIIG